MNSNSEKIRVHSPRILWLIYHTLLWIFVLVLIVFFAEGLLHIKRQYIEIYKHLPYIEYSIKFIFLIGCIGAIARRPWSAYLISLSGIWCLALYWSGIPSLTIATIEEIFYGPPVIIGGAPDFFQKQYPYYISLYAKSVGLILLITLIITSHIFSNRQEKDSTRIEDSSVKIASLYYLGIFIIFLGMFFKWLDMHIVQQIYAMTIGSYLVIAGAVLILIWQYFARNLFITASAVGLSVIFFIYEPGFASFALTFVLWLPVIALLVVGLFKEKMNVKLRIASMSLLVIFLLFSLSPSVISIPLYMRFGKYHKETSKRPTDFPDYMKAPSGSTNTRYRGGDRAFLSFTINDPYPASKTLKFITDNLQHAGWKKLNYKLMAPEYESSHLRGWSDLRHDFERNIKCYHWMADWLNDRNETLLVILEYRFPDNADEDLTTLHCHISQHPPDGFHLEFIKNYMLIHPDANEQM